MWSKLGSPVLTANVGGGYPDAGLSDQALVWMIARLQALTGLEFDIDAVKAGTHPNISGTIVDSTDGWPIDHPFHTTARSSHRTPFTTGT
jgi:hypothetical protein